MHHLVFGINFQIHSVSLTILVLIIIIIIFFFNALVLSSQGLRKLRQKATKN